MTQITTQVIREQFVAANVHVEWDIKHQIAHVCYYGDDIIDECDMDDLITLRDVLSSVITRHGPRLEDKIESLEKAKKSALDNMLDARGKTSLS